MTDKDFLLTKTFFNDIIKILSDSKMQKRCWFGEGGKVCDSYDEMVNSFRTFLDFLASDPSQYGLTKEEYECILTLHKKIETYQNFVPYPGDHPQMDSIPQWSEVITYAKMVYNKLKRFEDPSMQ